MAATRMYRFLSKFHSLMKEKSDLPTAQQEMETFSAIFIEEIQTRSCPRTEKLLFLTIVKTLFQNCDKYVCFCEMLNERGIFSYLLETMSRVDDLFILYMCKESIVSILVSPVLQKERHSYLTLLCDTLCNQSAKTRSRVTAIEIYQQLLSNKPKLDGKTAIHTDILRHFHFLWPGLVEEILSLQLEQLNSEEIYTYAVTAFMKLWKKIIKMLHRTVDKTFFVYIETVNILLQKIPSLPVECYCSSTEVLHAVFSQSNGELQSDLRVSITNLAHQLLSSMTSGFMKLVAVNPIKGFLGHRNVGTDHNSAERNESAGSMVLKIYTRCCCLVFSPTAAPEEKWNPVWIVCHCLDDLTAYFNQPLPYVVLKCFEEQDDDYFDVSLDLLIICINLRNLQRHSENSRDLGRDGSRVEEICQKINPHQNFLLYLKHTHWDTSLLLDFIISPETCFLKYLTQYLKFVTGDWDFFVLTCQEFQSMPTSPNAYQVGLSETQGIFDDGSLSHHSKLMKGEDPYDTQAEVSPDSASRTKSAIGPDCTPLSCTDQSSMRSDRMTETLEDTESDSGSPDCTTQDCVNANLHSPKTNKSQCCIPLVDYSDSSDDDKFTGIEHKQQDLEQKLKRDPMAIDLDTTDKDYQSNETLEKFMSVLIRLGLKLGRMYKYDLLAFNIAPLKELITKCELNYES